MASSMISRVVRLAASTTILTPAVASVVQLPPVTHGYTCCSCLCHSNHQLSQYRLYSNDDKDTTRLRIYTRTGDKGTSSNFAGQRLPKDDLVFEALGSNDELSSSIGLAREFCIDAIPHDHHPITNILQEIQCVLQNVGSHIATPRDAATPKKLARTTFNADHVKKLEKWIDEFDDQLPELKAFILPSGGKSSASLHLARTICRRTERRVIPLYKAGQVDHEVAMYLNRLSDLLFTLARYGAQKEGKQEVIYQRID